MLYSGLIEIYKGCNHKGIEFEAGEPAYPPRLATRYRPLPPLIELAYGYGLSTGKYKDAFLTELPKKTIEVRATKIKGEGKGRRMKPPQTAKFEPFTKQVKSLKNFLPSFTVTGTDFRGFRRLFNEGDRDDFDYNHGGRLHHADGEGDIGLPSSQRQSVWLIWKHLARASQYGGNLSFARCAQEIAVRSWSNYYCLIFWQNL